MQYLAAHYWQSANENPPSFLLQQVYHKKRKLPILITCMCECEKERVIGERIVTDLADWFYEVALPLCVQKGELAIEGIGKSLKNCLKTEEENLEGVWLSGLFCVGRMLCFWGHGEANVRLLNTKKQASQIKELKIGDARGPEISLCSGMMEPGVGILLGTKDFYRGIPLKVMEECLDKKELVDLPCMERRLSELGNMAEANGGMNRLAVLLVTKEEDE